MARPVSRGEGPTRRATPRPAPRAGGRWGGTRGGLAATTGEVRRRGGSHRPRCPATPDSTPPQRGGGQMKRPAPPSGWPKVWGPSSLPSAPNLAVTLSGSLRSTKPGCSASLRSGFDLSCPDAPPSQPGSSDFARNASRRRASMIAPRKQMGRRRANGPPRGTVRVNSRRAGNDIRRRLL